MQPFTQVIVHPTGGDMADEDGAPDSPDSPRGCGSKSKPALFTAGRRRRQPRPSPLPRITTVPILEPQHAASSLISSVSSAFAPWTPSASMQSKGSPSGDAVSPAQSTATPTEGRKKGQGFFRAFKGKERADNAESAAPAVPDLVISSPKALRVLGLPSPDNGYAAMESGSPKRSRRVEGDYPGIIQAEGEDIGIVNKLLRKTPSMQWLTWKKHQEGDLNDAEPNLASSVASVDETLQGNREKGEHTAKVRRMLDILGNRPKSSGRGAAASGPGEQVADVGYQSDGGLSVRHRPLRSAPPPRRRNRRKKGPKSLDRMSPITEMSSLYEKNNYLSDEEIDAELDVIAEYDTNDGRSAYPRISRSVTAPMLPQLPHPGKRIDESTASPAIDEKEFSIYVGVDNGLGSSEGNNTIYRFDNDVLDRTKAPVMPQVKSPLQDMERVLLNNTEERMKMDAETHRLEKEHLKMKEEFKQIKERQRRSFMPSDESYNDPDSDDDDDDDDSAQDPGHDDFCGEYPSNEEPIIETARPVTFMRVTPGMVKLVDIPPRRSAQAKVVGGKDLTDDPRMVKVVSIPPRNPRRLPQLPKIETGLKAPGKKPVAQDDATPRQTQIVDDGPAPVKPVDAVTQGTLSSPTPGTTTSREGFVQPENRMLSSSNPFRSAQYPYTKGKKLKLPREESRNLIEGWLADHPTTPYRSAAAIIGQNDLTDQTLDNAPPLLFKGPARANLASSPRHYCVHGGHVFVPIDLKRVPDSASVNKLQVSPYLRTSVGIEEHVRIPFACEKCGHDVNEEVWECEVPVCHLAVCQPCAVGMQVEWENRAVGSWENVDA